MTAKMLLIQKVQELMAENEKLRNGEVKIKVTRELATQTQETIIEDYPE